MKNCQVLNEITALLVKSCMHKKIKQHNNPQVLKIQITRQVKDIFF